jgi:hypothetical protein
MRGEITWRKYAQSDLYQRDLDALIVLHAEQETILARDMDLPDMMKPPVLEAWVAERAGVVVGGFYCEAVVEPVFFGRDPEVTYSARKFAPVVLAGLAARSFRIARIQVPRWIGRDTQTICRELKTVGFHSTDPEYQHLVFDLRPLATASRNERR